jgi:outer membrane protein OmpA-like peptidoglycan-associated protein
MKKPPFFFILFCFTRFSMAQPSMDTTGLILQKENTITSSTIVKIENLGPNINTSLAELRPTVSADGNLLFFIVENDPMNTKYNSVPNSQDIWFSERDSFGNWGAARHMGYPLNTYFYNAVFWISPDNNRILIRNAFIDGDYVGNGVSMSYKKKNSGWSKPNALRIKNYQKYDRGRQYGATMAHDGKTLLLYMSQEKDSYNNDLYVCFLQPDSTWSEPRSLGKKINLPDYNEMTPYLAADGVTLYFSSDRPGGLGDIVRVKLLEKEKPNPVVMVDGNVYNKKTNQPLSASLIYETLPDGAEAGNGISNPADGSFKIVLPYDKNYLLRASADKFFAISENLNLDSLVKAGYKEIHKDLYLVPIEVGQVVRLNNVFFDFDKWNLRPESFVELDRVVKLLKDNPAIEIEMSAHTDSYGSDDYNFKLSDNRARSCMEYILSQGIDSSRVTSHGYGETMPVAPNDSPENRQLNRRVEFKILKD